jgi:hypothetical protein
MASEPNKKDSAPRRVRLDFMLFLATLMAAIFAGYQACVSEHARKDAEKIADTQLKQAAEQFRIQNDKAKADSEASSAQTLKALDIAGKNAAQAKRSADAAEASARLQAEVFKKQQRPWIGIDGVTFIATQTEHEYQVTVTVKSRVSGLTPATNVANKLDVWLGDEVLKKEYDFLKYPEEPSLLPGATPVMTFHLRHPLKSKTPLELQSDQVYVRGAILYLDVFREVHITNVCFVAILQLGEHDMLRCPNENTIE